MSSLCFAVWAALRLRVNVIHGLGNYRTFGIGDGFAFASCSIILRKRSSIAFFIATSSCISCNLLLLTKKGGTQVAQHLFLRILKTREQQFSCT